jgi:hypothetical protein
MTYTQKLIAITESLTTDKVLSAIAAKWESNSHTCTIEDALKNVENARIELKVCRNNVDVSQMITAVESAIKELNDSLIALHVVMENEKLIDMLFRCTGKEITEG